MKALRLKRNFKERNLNSESHILNSEIEQFRFIVKFYF